ncbi:unnamed protein product [Orchesella dallaii]|uniref:F-box domain-containing protein n=1 Tax=Orchesella dallaii TaxID=48710 RepID=A0ABP1RUM6_9HEXA
MEKASTSNNCATDPASDQQLDNNQHPMLNHVILKNIFGMVPFKLEEFKNFRLVSYVWNECAGPIVHKNSWLNLNANAETLFDDDGSVLLHIPLLDSILECLEKSHELTPLLNGTLHFKKYLISNHLLGNMHERHFRINFWGKFGPLMTHLDISDAYIDAKDLREIILELTPNLQVFIFKGNLLSPTPISNVASNVLVWDEGYRPQQFTINKNLTHLTIMDINIELRGLPFKWIDIICHFPNLKHLKLGLESMSIRFSLRSLEEFLQAVILVRQNCGQHYLAQLQHLDIVEIPENIFLNRLPRKILDLLRQLAFPLSTLALDIGVDHSRVDSLALKNTLELHSTSLQNLTVYQNFCVKPFRFYLQLPHLTHLKLIGYIPKNLYFLNELPMLKTFVLLDRFSSVGVSNMKPEWSATFSGVKFKAKKQNDFGHDYPVNTTISCANFRGVILPNLETLVVGTQFLDGKQMKNLAKLAPNIKTLQLGMGNSGFRIVCKYWSQLEHVHVEPMDVDEDGIFGVRNGERYRLPNIRDLKSLKSISLGYSSEQQRRVNQNLADDYVAAAVLPKLEAALNGRDVQVYRGPATVASSSSENDDSD